MSETPGIDRQPPKRSLTQRAWRALLELDRPFPDLSEAELESQAERDYAWNLTVNVGDGASFLFGAAFLASSTILPLFLSKLTDAPLAFGLLAVIAAGRLVPPAALHSKRNGGPLAEEAGGRERGACSSSGCHSC